VPLAICLTARRAALHDNLAELWKEWEAAGTAVAELRGAAPGRLTSVPQSIEFSLRSARLTDAGRRLFQLFGQLPAGIADVDRRELPGRDAFAAHEQVLGVGLAFTRADRLDLLPPVRDHARRIHSPMDEDTAWYLRYLNIMKTLGSLVGMDGGAEALERLIPELPNIEAAFDVAIASGLLTPAVEAQHGLCKTLRFSGLGSPRVLHCLATACAAGGDARGTYQRGEANCIICLGDIALARSDHDEAQSCYEEALAQYRGAKDLLGEAISIRSLGDVAFAQDDHQMAMAYYRDALPLHRGAGDLLGEANCIRGLGDVARNNSDLEEAQLRYEDALHLYRRVSYLVGESNCVLGLGRVAQDKGDYGAARRYFESALALSERVDHKQNIAVAHESLAGVTLGSERDAHVHAAKEIWQAINFTDLAANVDSRVR
jgi:tetratricopeptide (TPR) repeat protein